MATNGINNADLAKSRIHSWKKFGLRSSPFDNSFKCNYGNRIEHFQAILNKLNSFCSSYENTAIVTGDSGVGKTLMFNDFMKEPDDKFSKIAITSDSSAVEILNAISSSLSLNLMVVGSNKNAYIMQIAHAILSQEARFVLVCDDANKLINDSFNTIIELLTHPQLTDHIKVILFGNPSIFERIIKYAVLKDSGIKLQHCIMHALSEDQLKPYIHNCLAKSGWPGALPEIPTSILHEIHEESGGIPRRINIAAEKILLSSLPAQEPDTKKPHTTPSHMATAIPTWQHPLTVTLINLGFVVMLYGCYLWYKDNSITKVSKVTEPVSITPHHTKAVHNQQRDDLLELINQNLEKPKVYNTPLPKVVHHAQKPLVPNAHSKVLMDKINEVVTPSLEHLSGYTIQLLASSNLEALIDFRNQQHLERKMHIYETSMAGDPWYVLVYGNFLNKKDAKDTIAELEREHGFKGLWAKSFLDIHLSSNSYVHML